MEAAAAGSTTMEAAAMESAAEAMKAATESATMRTCVESAMKAVVEPASIP
jgi:hypothetical protein